MVRNIVILHGWSPVINRKWPEFAAALGKAGYKIYFPKIPGLTGAPLLKAWHLTDFAAWLNADLKKQGIPECVLLGHSFGGSIALQYALQYKDGLKGLILINSAGIRLKSRKKTMIAALAETGKRLSFCFPFGSLKSRFRPVFYRLIGSTDYLKTKGYLTPTFRNIMNEDLSGKIARIRLPVLLLWGGRDKDTPLTEGRRINRAIRHSRLVVFNQAAHGLPFQEPARLTRHITEFMKKIN